MYYGTAYGMSHYGSKPIGAKSPTANDPSLPPVTTDPIHPVVPPPVIQPEKPVNTPNQLLEELGKALRSLTFTRPTTGTIGVSLYDTKPYVR